MTYNPHKKDVDWTQNLIDTLTDGGVWIIPVSQTAIKINKKDKIYVVNGPIDHPCNLRVFKVMSVLGWTLHHKPN